MTKRNIMTENLREEIAKELGVYEQVKKDGGWENKNKKIQIVKFLSNNLNFFHAISN